MRASERYIRVCGPVIEKVAHYVRTVADLCVMGSVCREWRRVCRSDGIWRARALRMWHMIATPYITNDAPMRATATEYAAVVQTLGRWVEQCRTLEGWYWSLHQLALCSYILEPRRSSYQWPGTAVYWFPSTTITAHHNYCVHIVAPDFLPVQSNAMQHHMLDLYRQHVPDPKTGKCQNTVGTLTRDGKKHLALTHPNGVDVVRATRSEMEAQKEALLHGHLPFGRSFRTMPLAADELPTWVQRPHRPVPSFWQCRGCNARLPPGDPVHDNRTCPGQQNVPHARSEAWVATLRATWPTLDTYLCANCWRRNKCAICSGDLDLALNPNAHQSSTPIFAAWSFAAQKRPQPPPDPHPPTKRPKLK